MRKSSWKEPENQPSRVPETAVPAAVDGDEAGDDPGSMGESGGVEIAPYRVKATLIAPVSAARSKTP
jgi:hypothetical protein